MINIKLNKKENAKHFFRWLKDRNLYNHYVYACEHFQSYYHNGLNVINTKDCGEYICGAFKWFEADKKTKIGWLTIHNEWINFLNKNGRKIRNNVSIQNNG